MKPALALLLLFSASLAQIAGPVASNPISQTMRLCEDTDGTWNTSTLSCDCPDGFAFDPQRGCHNTRAELLCAKTQGSWFVNNRRVPPEESCDCGIGRAWSEDDGCHGNIIDSLFGAILSFVQSLLPAFMHA